MTRWARTLVAVVATTCLVSPAPAGAATASRTGRVGDAPAIIDISGFTVRNDPDRVVVSIDVPRLRSRGGFAINYSPTREGGLFVFVRKNGGGPFVSSLYCGELRCHDVDCPHLRASWSTVHHQVRVVVPQSCYPAPLPDPGVVGVTSGSRSDYDDAGSVRLARG